MLKHETRAGRHLVSKPLWIKDPNFMDLQSLMRSDYCAFPSASHHLGARSFKPKVSAYRSTLNLTHLTPTNYDLSRTLTSAYLPTSPELVTKFLNKRFRSQMFIDDSETLLTGWQKQRQTVTSNEPFNQCSTYKENYPPKSTEPVTPMRPKHIPLKTAEKFQSYSTYVRDFRPKLEPKLYRSGSFDTIQKVDPLEVKANDIVRKDWPSVECIATERKSTSQLDYKAPNCDLKREIPMCRNLAPKIKATKVTKPPFEVSELHAIPNTSYQSYFGTIATSRQQLNHSLHRAAGLVTRGGPITYQRQTYSVNQPQLIQPYSMGIQSTGLPHVDSSSVPNTDRLMAQIVDAHFRSQNRWPYLQHNSGCFYSTRR